MMIIAGVEGWQLESGEVPKLSVGAVVDLSLEIRLLPNASIGECGDDRANYLTHVAQNRYRCNGRFATVPGRLLLESQLNLFVSYASMPLIDADARSGYFEGGIEVSIDASGGDTTPPELVYRWKVLRVEEVGTRNATTRNVKSTEARIDRRYFVHCQLLEG